MDTLYSASQPYALYEHQWNEESKPTFISDDHDPSLDDKILETTNSTNQPSESEGGRPTLLKVEEDFSTSATPTAVPVSQMWQQERSHEIHPVRSYSTSHPSLMNGATQHFMRINDPTFTMQHSHTWSVPHSGTSTPTPLYTQAYDMSFTHPTPGFHAYAQDPASAVSMSPQSSQGGWGSTTSSDGTDQRGMISPTYRPTSPGTVVRPDGIRKKNARFEIPKERNLANIDAMIMASTDENEKKELKQQKRLLRNRQAALDSRQRKKTHTEKLEQEKKISEKKMFDLEEALARLENTLTMEREQFMQQRQHMENVIHALQYERDEAIRTKTLETAELRRTNNMLKDFVRDLESQQQHEGYAPASHMHYNNDYQDFDPEDNWEDEFSLINSEDLKMDESDAMQRQATPKPTTSIAKPVDIKADQGFSLATFYMCLLFGAFIASNNTATTVNNHTASAFASSISSAEASNVIKTVLSSGGVPNDILPSRTDATVSASANEIGSIQSAHLDSNIGLSSGLDHLHQSLSSPTRRQEMAAAFSMSADSYQHLTDPFNEHLNVDANHQLLEPPPPPPPRQTELQKAFASMQAQRDNIDKITGMGSKARERSLLWDQVPPEVIKNFEAMVHGNANNNNLERMEQ